jgi:GTP-binding protein LepA
VIVYFRIMSGGISKKDKVLLMASKKSYELDEIGVMAPDQVKVNSLHAGEVGYLAASIKAVADARVGDTITLQDRPAEKALPGYTEAKPMVFCGLFPTDADQYPDLREALDKLQLSDAALKYEPETSSAMGFGFRCGFLGLLHMEIVQERLEREYDLDLIVTAPSVIYKVKMTDGEVLMIDNPATLPDPQKRETIEEPYVRMEIYAPNDYNGTSILTKSHQSSVIIIRSIYFHSDVRFFYSFTFLRVWKCRWIIDHQNFSISHFHFINN